MAAAERAAEAGPLGVRRLPQGLPVLAGALDDVGLGRPGRQQQPDDDTGQGRVHARGLHRHPQRDAHQHVRRQAPDTGPPQAEQRQHQDGGTASAVSVEVVGVEERHHGDRADVVDDGQGEQEQPEPVGAARPEQRQDAEHERGVGRHDDAPAGTGRAGAVDRQVDRGRDEQPAERAERRGRDVPAVAQLPDADLAGDLEADDQEEQRHGGVVDPVPEVERELEVPDADRGRGVPEGGVALRPGRVRPGQRHDGRDQQECGAARLRAEVELGRGGQGGDAHPLGGARAGRLRDVEHAGQVTGRAGRTSRRADRRSVRCGRRRGRGSRPRRRCAPRAGPRPR